MKAISYQLSVQSYYNAYMVKLQKTMITLIHPNGLASFGEARKEGIQGP